MNFLSAILSVTPTPMTIQNALDAGESIITELLSWVGLVLTAIWDNPLILLFFVMPLGLMAFKIVKMLVRTT